MPPEGGESGPTPLPRTCRPAAQQQPVNEGPVGPEWAAESMDMGPSGFDARDMLTIVYFAVLAAISVATGFLIRWIIEGH
jgi:hypothetical protein